MAALTIIFDTQTHTLDIDTHDPLHEYTHARKVLTTQGLYVKNLKQRKNCEKIGRFLTDVADKKDFVLKAILVFSKYYYHRE